MRVHRTLVSGADRERQLDQLPGFIIQWSTLVGSFAELVVGLG
jgi:hypothetical protein